MGGDVLGGVVVLKSERASGGGMGMYGWYVRRIHTYTHVTEEDMVHVSRTFIPDGRYTFDRQLLEANTPDASTREKMDQPPPWT